MKKQKSYSAYLLTLLSTSSSGQKFLILVLFLILFLLLSWHSLSSYFRTEIRTTSTASYEGLDPKSYGYWRERAERDIASAHELAKSSMPLNKLLNSNLSATIRAASQLKDPAEKALAISTIIYAQINQNVNTNIDEALLALGNSSSVRSLRMNLAASLAFFYLSTNRSKAETIVQNYLALLKEVPFNTEDVEQKNALIQILDACVVLNLDRELDSALRSLLASVNSIASEKRQNLLLAFIAEQQIRFQKYADVFVTLSQMTQPDLLAKCYQKLIESHAQISTPFLRESGNESLPEVLLTVFQSKIRQPALVTQTLEQVFSNIGRIKDQQTQQKILWQLLESDIMAYTSLHDLVRNVLIETKYLSLPVKTYALSLVDNPRSETLRKVRGMPPLISGTERTEGMTDQEYLDYVKGVLIPQPLSKNRMYQEDIRVLTNTATELLAWGKKKEAIPLLIHAATRMKGLDLENKQGVSRTALAAILVSAGEIETAQELLHEESEILTFSQKTLQTDWSYSRVAEIQLRSRLLGETFNTLREMLPSPTKGDLLQSLVREQLIIGQLDDAIKSVAEMPYSTVKTTLQRSLEETARRWCKMDENIYTYLPLEEILQTDWPDQQQRLFDLVATQLQEGLLIDARETARHISDPVIRDRALDLIVQESMVVFRAYFSKLSQHQQIRKNTLSFGFQTAKEMVSPQNRLLATERLYSQATGVLDPDEILPEWEEILTLWNSLSMPEELIVKIDCGLRLFQNELRRHASEVHSRIGGNWHVLPENTSFPSAEHKQILLTVAEWVPQLQSAGDRAVRSAQLAALFYQIHDLENGKSQVEAAADACEAVEQKNITANVCLSLAQTLHEAGKPEKAEEMFVRAIVEAEKILSDSGKRGGRLQDRRMKDRILTEICRGQAEIGQVDAAMLTSTKIGEKFFVDRLCKTIGYLQISQGAYEEAETTFKKIKDPTWRNSSLNDVLFRLRWDALALYAEPEL